jgi:hypothetical protein
MADPAHAADSNCPFCGLDLLPNQQVTRDHVFGRAMGGRVVVSAHRTCNNQFGAGAEGEMQRPNTVGNLLKAAFGLRAGTVRVTFPSGRPASLDLRTGRVRADRSVTRAEDGLIVRIEGTEAQVRSAYLAHRSRHPELGLPEFEDLPPECVGTVSYQSARVDLALPLAAAEAVAVKSALGACVLAYGPRFAATPLAAALRTLLNSPTAQGPAVPPDRLGILDAQIALSAAEAGLSPEGISALPRLVPQQGQVVHDVILVPYNQQTLLFAHYLSAPIPPYGFIVAAPLPPLTPDLPAVLPLLLRDGGTADHLEITDFTQRLMQPVIDAALASSADINLPDE